ncbi:hypothetical protein EVA_10690 [gut metagenome]|uniref:Uncharacterized protein n=1 Tax=gut metagenome TaxID=749906 RepID=J9G2X9_9ZZZZ
MKICPKCHSEYVDSLNYCQKCGTPLIDKAAADPAWSNTETSSAEPVILKKKLSLAKKMLLAVLGLTLVLVIVYDYLGSLTSYLRVETTQLVATKTGGEISVGVDCDGLFWTVAECPEWLSTSHGEGKIHISAGANATGKMRKGQIVLESGKHQAAIAVVQTGVASYLQPQQQQLHFPRKGGRLTLKVNTDGGEWQVQYPSYLKANKVDENTLDLSVEENRGTVHEDYLLLTEDNVRAVVKVSQGGICKSCQGKGQMVCPFCSGVSSGYFVCYRCGGTGILRCSACRGAGIID